MISELPPFVQDLFDRGGDPLADADAHQWLLQHPEALEAFAAARRALGELVHVPRAARPRLHAWPWLAVLAAALIATAAIVFAGESQAAPRPLPRPDFAPMTIVSCRVQTSEVDSHGARSRVLSGNQLQTTEHFALPPTPTVRQIAASLVEQRTLAP